jgi:hypothetical protein
MYNTKQELEVYIESDESLEFRDDNFHYLFLDCDNCKDKFALHNIPYWLESFDNVPDKKLYSHGSQGEYLGDIIVKNLKDKVFLLSGQDYNPDNEKVCRHIEGYYSDILIGDIITLEGKKLIFVDTVSLPEEIEHQVNDGSLCYEYRGPSYLQIFVVL